jgi:hypothetical protein
MRTRFFGARFQVLAFVLISTADLVVAGCSGDTRSQAAKNLLSVDIGMTESQVLAIMGQPQRREIQGGTQFLIYATDGKSEEALIDFIPIAIVDGRVTGIGRQLYDHVVRSQSNQTTEQQKGGDSSAVKN